MAANSVLEVTPQKVTNADINLEVTLRDDSEIQMMGLNRSTINGIGIEFSYTVENVTVKLINETGSTANDAAITDVYRLPAGAVVRIVTTGIVAGTADAVIILDPRMPV